MNLIMDLTAHTLKALAPDPKNPDSEAHTLHVFTIATEEGEVMGAHASAGILETMTEPMTSLEDLPIYCIYKANDLEKWETLMRAYNLEAII